MVDSSWALIMRFALKSHWEMDTLKSIILVSILLCVMGSALADESYFPTEKNGGADAVTPFEAKWYSEPLKRMKEPRLPDLAKDANAEIYRLMILPTWGNPVVVRIQRDGKSYRLWARRLDGQGGYDPGKLTEAKDIDLSAYDSNALDTLIQNLQFFQLSTTDKVRGFDGDEWILEGVSHGKYHLVQRWCAGDYDPSKRGLTAFLALSTFLLDKSALSDRPKNKGHKII